jgi:hypothetical protein
MKKSLFTGLMLLGGVIADASAKDFISLGLKEAARRTCKQASSCEEAVIMWCEGYRGADRDSDGVPCENVCSSRHEVEEIESRISCNL